MGSSNVVTAWTESDRVHFYDQRNGRYLSERVIERMASMDRQNDRWRAFLDSLRAPNDLYLPQVRSGEMILRATEDGKIRLYQLGDRSFFIEVGGRESALEFEPGVSILALDLDRVLGLVALCDQSAKLHVFQQRIRVGTYDTGLSFELESTPLLVVPHGGKTIIVTSAQQICVVDVTGKVKKRMELHYPVSALACSPDGRLLVTSDADTGVVRVYNAEDMRLAYQRFAIDLAADTRRLNAGAGGQPATNIPTTLALSNRGVLAFALGGLLCVTSVSKMKAISSAAVT
jgi:WD40 repeat protein